MRSVRVLPAILLLVLAPPALAAEKFQLDASHSKIGFTATLAAVSDVEGRFTDMNATIMYDEADLAKSTVTVIIRSASGDVMLEIIDRDGIDAALGKYPELAKDTAGYHFAPNQLRVAGRKLLERGKKKEALAVLKLNASLYPDDSRTFDALGDALIANGQRDAAAHAFQRALELDANDTGAIESLRPPPA